MYRHPATLYALLLTLLCGPAFADDDGAGPGPWQVRLRMIVVLPDVHARVTPLGGSVRLGESYVPEADVTYFFDEHWSAELIAGTTHHHVKHIPTDTDLGSVWLLPPTLTAQYHFDQFGPMRPYLGAGVNYTIFYDADSPPGLHLGYKNRFGWALQAGADIPFGDSGYFFNVDVKKVFLSTSADVNHGAIIANVDINPWIVGFGVGLRF